MSEDFEEKIGEEDLGDGFTVKQGSDDTDVVEPDELDTDLEVEEPEEEEDPEAAEMFSLMYAEYDER